MRNATSLLSKSVDCKQKLGSNTDRNKNKSNQTNFSKYGELTASLIVFDTWKSCFKSS